MRNANKQLKQKTSLSFVLLLFALVTTFALSGCGGGGGGGGANMGGQQMPDGGQQMPGGGDQQMPGGGDQQMPGGGGTYTPPARTRILSNVAALPDSHDPEIISDLQTAAESIPRPGNFEGIGHVTQSSASTSGRTQDRWYFAAEIDSGGDLHINRVLRTSRTLRSSTKDSGVTFNRLAGAPAQGWNGVETEADYPTGLLYWDAFTDIENDSDTDYLSIAYWIIVFKDSNTGDFTEDTSIGTAASGSDPYSANNLAGLTGSATYQGPASGMLYIDSSDADVEGGHYFNATATLNADFGDGSATGTISGMITQAMTESDISLPDLTLGNANINDNFPGGNFNGDTSGMTDSGDTLSGKWGGKFYSNGASATDHPGSVAGTFGARNQNDNSAIIGAFGAYKQ